LRTKETVFKPDIQLLDQPELASLFIEGMRKAFRNGIKGAIQESALYARPWRLNLRDITAEVHLWHGEQDLNVPVSVGRFIADTIPNCNAIFHNMEGHFTLPHHHIREILSILVA
jgi:pimeloyl-ACP methyl ester carboxylesterase